MYTQISVHLRIHVEINRNEIAQHKGMFLDVEIMDGSKSPHFAYFHSLQ